MRELLTTPLAGMPDPLPIPPIVGRVFDATIRPPGSKSLTNRALLLAGLSEGRSVLRGALTDADDAQRMIEAMQRLGAELSVDADAVRVRGVAGRWATPPGGVSLDLGNAGTATRFLAAAAVFAGSPVTIDGNTRMRERPIGELGGVLPALGMDVEYLGRAGYPPLKLVPPAHPPASPMVNLFTTKSGQFLSALLMCGPWLRGGITLRLEGEVTSRPYVLMTLRLLDRLGARVRSTEDMRVMQVGGPAPSGEDAPRGLSGFELDIEPDASGATYFWGAAAMHPGAGCRVEGLGRSSLQGDARFVELLARMGADVTEDASGVTVRGTGTLHAVDTDMRDMPDAAMTLAAVCCAAEGPSVLRGLRTLRDKETDRIEALRCELSKIDARVEVGVGDEPDAIRVTPPPGGLARGRGTVEFATYDDHRMAMSLSLIGLCRPGVVIRDPGCVRKTYARFWGDLAALLPA